MPQVDCNLTDTPWPNGLPPNWCIQAPMDGVSMWFNQTVFELKNSNKFVTRATVRRTFTSGETQTYDFDINAEDETDPILWLVGTDTGALEMVSVIKTPDDGPLEGLDHVRVQDKPGNQGARLIFALNQWPVPVYLSVDVYDNKPVAGRDSFRRVLRVGEDVLLSAYDYVPVMKWRAAVLQRKDLFTPWPPAIER
ncbi:hypothetical protein SAMN05444172_2575 [Burkholderia sp. GAS332]|nr:hypothetical protein SAMN05444172_2575 [Burkholderia sp. GAS332]